MARNDNARRSRWKRAPLITLEDLSLGGPILVIAPHPDDETLGCGGLISQAVEAGISVRVAILTDGAASHPNSTTHPPPVLTATRQSEAVAALQVLGVPANSVDFHLLPDGKLARDDQNLMTAITNLVSRLKVKVVFATWGGDSHPDHQAAYWIALEAARRGGSRIWAYPIWGHINDSPSGDQYPDEPAVRLPVRLLRAKAAAIACHKSQLGQLIFDDPEGFQLRPEEVRMLSSEDEVFIQLDALP